MTLKKNNPLEKQKRDVLKDALVVQEDQLLVFAKSLLGRQAFGMEAKEIVQSAAVKILTHASAYDTNMAPGPWMKKFVLNEYRSYINTRNSRGRYLKRQTNHSYLDTPSDEKQHQPDYLVIYKDKKKEFFSVLNDKEKSVMTLTIDGYSIDEIIQDISSYYGKECSRGEIYKLRHSARKKIEFVQKRNECSDRNE